MRRRVFLSGAILTGVGLPLLAGCKLPWQSKRQTGSTSASASAGKASGTAVPAASAAPQGWQELDAHVMGHHLGFQVSPLVRRDEKTTVLVLKLTRAKDDPAVKDVVVDSLDKDSNVFNAAYSLARPGSNPAFEPAAGGVRLLDLSTNRVWVATTGVENKVKGNNNKLSLKPGASTSCFVLFGPVDAKEVTVFVPQAGFVTVNVLDSSAAAASGINFKAIDKAFDSATIPQYTRDEADPKQALAAPVPIERYTKALDDSTSTHTGSKDITVTLASDVTFASDSADLTSAADTQLKTVAGQLAQYPDGGTLTIVGHTDDVQDDAYNQTLSEKRANAVKTRLEQLTKLDKWQTSVSGKGESEPKVKGTSEEARAANRRVEITLTPTGGTTPKNTPTPNSSGGKLPDPQGSVAKGPEGVTLTATGGSNTSGEVTITLDHVTRSGSFLLGTVTCTVKDGSNDVPLHPLLEDPETPLSNQRSESGALSTLLASDGLTLLSNGERIFPADYLDADVDHHLPLTELRLLDHLEAGTTTVCVVWPDPGGDTITLDHAKGEYSVPGNSYRLTDIPVKNS